MDNSAGFGYHHRANDTVVAVVSGCDTGVTGISPEFNKSWFVRFGTDRNRSYFTYYSEFNRSSPGIVYVEIVFLCLLTILSTIGNVFIAFVVISNKKLHTNTNLFITNMCVADILFTIMNPVISVVRYQGTWQLGKFLCGFLFYTQFVCGAVLIWSMALISIDRYRRVVKLQPSNQTITIHAKIAVAVCWFIALGLLIPVSIYFRVEKFDFGREEAKVCTLMWPKGTLVRLSIIYVAFACIFVFLIPLTTLLYNYIVIFKTLWNTSLTMKKHKLKHWVQTIQQPEGTMKNHIIKSASNKRHFRRVRMFVTSAVIFGLMWLPMFIVFVLILRDGITEDMQTSSWSFLLAVCIAFANASVNPILYTLFNEKFRDGIRKALHR